MWTEDPNKDSFKVCLREVQNFDGKHEDINVVCTLFESFQRINLYCVYVFPGFPVI